MASVMVTIELEVEVFREPVGPFEYQYRGVCQTVVPVEVAHWAERQAERKAFEEGLIPQEGEHV